MSKRGADEYITKENGSTPNTTELAKVKMATAAQMAKRKMAVPKSRAGRAGQSPMPGAGASSPFSGNNLFGAQQNTQQPTFSSTGSVTFGGASQSFPPTDTSNGGFNFSVPGQSASFTFGEPTTNNPFASMNGNANNEQSEQGTPDVMMESPQKKPAFGSNLFGSNSNTNTNTSQSAGFGFGHATSQPPSQPSFGFGKGFGNSATAPAFGQGTTTPTDSSPSPTLFGQQGQSSNAATPAAVTFGQKPESAKQQSQSSGFSFGSTTISSTSGSTPAFSFGQSASPAASVPSSTGGFKFGQTSAQPSSSTPLFGAASSSNQSTFGNPNQSSQPASVAPLFGAPQATTASNLFGGAGINESAESTLPNGSATVSEQQKPLFGQSLSGISQQPKPPTPLAAEAPSKSQPFAGLFGSSINKQPEPMPVPSDDSKSGFSFAPPTQSSNLFSSLKPSTNDSGPIQAESTLKKPDFSFGTPAAQPSTNLFSSSQSFSSSAAASNPFAGIAAKTPQLSEQKADNPHFKAPQQTPQKNDTGFMPLASFGQNSGTRSVQEQKTSTSGASGASAKQQSSSVSTSAPSQPLFGGQNSETQPQKASPLFGDQNTAKQQPAQPVDLFMQTARAAAALPSAAVSNSAKNVEISVEPKRAVSTNPPTRIPPYLNADDYKSYDSNYRLHSLNRELQKRIASLDPSREDFENIIRNYVAARESIGESIGLYTRNVAGMKRKVDEADHRGASSDVNSSKRSKPADEQSAAKPIVSNATTGFVFQPVPSSTPKPSSDSKNTPTNNSASPSKSSASSLFSSMIPDNKSTPGAAATSNPFANLNKTSSSTTATENAKPQFSFAAPATQTNTESAKPPFSFAAPATSTTAVQSTTPTKSPPKKPVIGMPVFVPAAAGTNNFMNAFKQQSEASAAKFAKEAKAKRKAEEFDSDEDDEEEWERKYEADEQAKKAKLNEIGKKGFTPTFSNGTTATNQPAFKFGNSAAPTSANTSAAPNFGFGKQDLGKSSDEPIDVSDNDASGEEEEDGEGTGDSRSGGSEEADQEDDETNEDELPEDEVDAEDEEDNEDLETVLANSRGSGKSLFDRVTPNPNLPKEFKSSTNATTGKETQPKANVFGSLFGKSSSEAPSFTSFGTSVSKDPYVPSKTFNFTPTPPASSPTPVQGASIFSGGAMKDGPIAGEGLFGSRPSTPSNADKPKSTLFGAFGTPGNAGTDHTWKKGSEIKFGQAVGETPVLSITEPSPRREDSKPFGNFFGSNSSFTSDPSSKPALGFNFGQSPVPGFLAAASHLAGGSGTNSGMSSRATSPGTTDNESVATNDDDYSQDTQVSLMEARPGEESERVLFETRAKALRFYKEEEIKGTKLEKGWNVVGVGIVRLLKHKETGKARMVMRAEPGANIILNTNLQPGIKYDYAQASSNGSVKFQVITAEGAQGWTLKTKTHQQGQDLSRLLEENKTVHN